MYSRDADEVSDSFARLYQLRTAVHETQQVEASLAHSIRPPDRARSSSQHHRPHALNRHYVSHVPVPSSPGLRNAPQSSISNHTDPSSRPVAPSSSTPEARSGRQVCWQYRDSGKCSRGAECRFLHASVDESPKHTGGALEQPASLKLIVNPGHTDTSVLEQSNTMLGDGFGKLSECNEPRTLTSQKGTTRKELVFYGAVENGKQERDAARLPEEGRGENKVGGSRWDGAKLQRPGVVANGPGFHDGAELRHNKFISHQHVQSNAGLAENSSVPHGSSRSFSQNATWRSTLARRASPPGQVDQANRTQLRCKSSKVIIPSSNAIGFNGLSRAGLEELRQTCLAEDEAVLRKLGEASDSVSRGPKLFAQKAPRLPRYTTPKAGVGIAAHAESPQQTQQQAGPARLKASLKQLREEMRLLQIVMREDDESLHQQLAMLQEGMSQLRMRSRMRSGNASLMSTAAGSAVSSPFPLSPTSEIPAPTPQSINAALSRIAEGTTPH